MKTPTLLCLLLLSACAASPTRYEQAAPAYVPVGPPPVMTPGYLPGTPAQPVYTPNGAGLPGERGPMPQPHALPASPNKRALPDEFSPTREAGIWAADGARNPDDVGFVRRLFGVGVPSPKESGDNMAQATVSACLRSMETAAQDAGLSALVYEYPADVRKCMAAKALRACTDRGLKEYEGLRKKALEYDAATMARRRAVAEHARTLEAAYCSGVELTDVQAGVIKGVIAEWLREASR